MLGFPVYLNKPVADQEKAVKDYASRGFGLLFTSLHIPEEDRSLYRERLFSLGRLAGQLRLGLIVDIDSHSLEQIGLSLDEADRLPAFGITGLRLDDGFDEQMSAELSNKIAVVLNASTLTLHTLKRMIALGLNVNRVTACHNYYPRPETGLDRSAFRRANRMLRQQGLSVAAFFPGDKDLRGPLYKRLPTLEDHRSASPFCAYIDLLHEGVDNMILGDPGMNKTSLEQFSAWQKRLFLLHAVPEIEDRAFLAQAASPQSNRPDEARDCIRSRESRLDHIFPSPIRPANTVNRIRGSVTVDNELYGRYQGEIQIARNDLPADPKVNVIGRIVDSDLPLLPFIHGSDAFQIRWTI